MPLLHGLSIRRQCRYAQIERASSLGHTNEVELIDNRGWDRRILSCRNGQLVNTFIVVTTRYVVLIDTMINAVTAAKLLDYARPYLTGQRRLLVVNTHADYDHAWGNQLFAGEQAQHPAPIIAHRLTVGRFDDLDSAISLAQSRTREPHIFGEVILTKPTILCDDQLCIAGGDLTLHLFATPGHTPDHIAVYMPEIRALLAADAAELPFPFAHNAAALPLMRASLAGLAALRPVTALYCHAPITVGPQLLHDNITYFDAIEAYCRAAFAAPPVNQSRGNRRDRKSRCVHGLPLRGRYTG